MKENLLLRVVGYAFSLLTLLSCATEPTQRESFSSEGYTQTVLYPRRTDAPIILTLPIKKGGSLRSTTDSQALHTYLARTYDPTAGILNSMECYKRPIFDIEALISYRPTAVDFLPLKRFDARYASFSSKQSYEKYLERKFSNEVGFNVGIPEVFSIGYKHTMSKAFSEDYKESSSLVYGIATLRYDYGRYWRSTDKFTKRKIKWNYLSKTFLVNLYGKSLQNTFENAYGVLMPIQIVTGAKAEGVFKGVGRRRVRGYQTVTEDNMSATISVGISYPKGDADISAKDSIGFSWKTENKWKDYFGSVMIATRTLGGGPAKPFNSAQSIDGFSIDFAPWLSTLRDPQDYTVTDVEQFESIADYVMEENFRQHIKLGVFRGALQEPKIVISNWLELSLPRETSKKLYLALQTRHGDEILLRPIHSDDEGWWTVKDEADFDAKANQLASIIKNRYNLEVVKTYYYGVNGGGHGGTIGMLSSNVADILHILRSLKPIEIPLYGMDEMKMTKCHHKGYNMEFLLYDGGRGKRYAFAIYDKSFIGTYGLEKIYNSASSVKLPDEYIMDDYIIIGL